MSNPDLEILKADIEMLLDLIDEHDTECVDGMLAVAEGEVPWHKEVQAVSARLRRILDSPADDSHVRESRQMNKDPRSLRED